jgi:hypothetical protein
MVEFPAELALLQLWADEPARMEVLHALRQEKKPSVVSSQFSVQTGKKEASMKSNRSRSILFVLIFGILGIVVPAQGAGIRDFLKAHRGTLLRLAAVTAAGEFDAWTTRRYTTAWQSLPTGGAWGPHPMRDGNPLQRPFQNSPAIYFTVPAQDLIVWSLVSIALRHHPKVYEFGVADGAVGYSSVDHVLAGFHNLRSAQAAQSLLSRTCAASPPGSPGCGS